MLPLPASRPRPAQATYRDQTERLWLPRELAERLKLLGRQEQTSLFAILLGAFQALLYRYTGSNDIVVGSAINSRTGEMERLVGPFTNPVALRTTFTGSMPFRRVIAQVRDVIQGAQTNGQVPFEKVLEALDLQQRLTDAPFFQVIFRDGSSLDGMATRSGLQVEEEESRCG